MAQNSSQPFHGFPFAYPPPPAPSSVPSAQAEDPRRPAHAQPPPAPDVFQSIPGLQQPSLPGITHGKNDQQPPFPPAAWPPQFPSHPGMWLPFLQNGVVPPPPLPGLPFPPPSLPQTPQTSAVPVAFPPYIPSQAPISASDRAHELMDSDREDGELSEGEIVSQPSVAAVNGPAYREPPRSVPHALHTSSAQTGAFVDRMQKNRDAARQFIKLLNSYNIGYRALANEALDTELLRGLYQSLNLPSEPAPILASKVNNATQKPLTQSLTSNIAVQASSSTKIQPHKSATTIKTIVTLPPSAKSAASPTIPVDRKDYIARLQAAKTAKQTTLTQSATPTPVVSNTQNSTTTSTKLPITDEQRARNTELIKQRLEAIKAKQKLPVNINKDPTPSPSIPPLLEQRQSAAQPVMQAAHSKINISKSPASMPPFPGIPGLFMSNSSNFTENVPGLPNPLTSIPRKRPAPSEFETFTSTGSITPASRRLGQSPRAHQDESIIIEVSDDESDGSDMEIDDDQTASKTLITSQASFQNQPQAPGILMDFSSRSTSTKPASPIGTALQQNPNILAREKELENKEKQLAAMRLTLKRKLAEKRAKDKAAATAAAAVKESSVSEESSVSVAPDVPASESAPLKKSHIRPSERSGAIHPIGDQFTNVTHKTAEVTVDTAENNKWLRRAEIRSKLPTLDAEVVTNTTRMAELTLEMERLMAQNEKITKDKEELAKELKSLGIGSVSMSNAQLGDKKDGVERHICSESDRMSHEFHALQPPVPESQIASVISSQEVNPKSNGDVEKLHSAKGNLAENYSDLPGLGQKVKEFYNKASADRSSTSEDEVSTPLSRRDISRLSGRQIDVRKLSDHANAALGRQGFTTPLEDDEDFYSSAPADEGHFADVARSQAGAFSDLQSPSEQGEIDISESSEYEPIEFNFGSGTNSQEARIPEPEKAFSITTSQTSTEDDEAYEPPEVDQDMSNTPSGVEALEPALEPTLQASHVEAEGGFMEAAASSSEQSDSMRFDGETALEPAMQSSMSSKIETYQETNTANNLASIPQPDFIPTLSNSEIMSMVDDRDSEIRFTTYASPLRMFKSYRYHPSFAHDVAGGFLSLTFSHQIDSEKQLCQYESAGGACNDTACPDQHFRDLNITGEKLLVQLGTANPGKSSEEKQKWNDGLRAVLKELRLKNIKDPNGIAMEIANYRRQFLNDDTRVVNL